MKFKFADVESGEIISTYEFNPSQKRFWTSPKKFVLFSGGYGCGKSLMLILKATDLCLRYPKNYILMGRKTYPELRDSLIKDFFNVVPDNLIQDYLKAEGRLKFRNGSEIIFRHLDTIAEGEIRSMNLGGFFIDQAEDISRNVFLGLRGRLRRQGIPDGERKGYLSTNPALTWLFHDFKQNPEPEYEVIEASTLENEKNLPSEYVQDLLKYPEGYKKQFVYGIWDSDLLADRIVIAREYQTKLWQYEMKPKFQREGLDVFKEYQKGHKYQMGVDPSEGVVEPGVPDEKQKSDEFSVSIVDLCCDEEVASTSGRIPPDLLAEKVEFWASLYSDKDNKITIVPEMNSIGLALVNALMKKDLKIYRREEFEKKTGKRFEKVGWRTTRQTKPLLVSHFQELCRLREPKIRSAKTLNQIKTFVYSDEANLNGMGAEEGFHDDRVIASFLAFWEKKQVTASTITSPGGGEKEKNNSPYTIIDGKIYPKRNSQLYKPTLEIEKSWVLK